ncbi:MAG: DUF1489 domain-containing protein [Rhodobacterales bacterium]
MTANIINIIKLSVGTESIETLAEWQANRRAVLGRDHALHITRMWPRRAPQVLGGGSMYWVIKGFVQARQKIIGLEEVIGDDGIRRCGIMLAPELIRTTAVKRRPFQGWRYLTPEDAPKDLPMGRATDDELPKDLEIALADLGLL